MASWNNRLLLWLYLIQVPRDELYNINLILRAVPTARSNLLAKIGRRRAICVINVSHIETDVYTCRLCELICLIILFYLY